MDRQTNLAHWESWAAAYGQELRATTKCSTIKRLEIEACLRNLAKLVDLDATLILEIGCGNGFNGFAFAESCPNLRYIGVDFSPRMIEQATRLDRGAQERVAFAVADARELKVPFFIDDRKHHHVGEALRNAFPIQSFEVILTDRMLINLASADEQLQIMQQVATALRPGGLFLMLENSVQSYEKLNEIRGAVGLEPRTPPEFNLLVDEHRVIEPFKAHMDLIGREYLSSLHDLMLYAVCPASGDGNVDYDTPLMKTLTEAIIAMNQTGLTQVAGLGQNVLWIWRKRD